MKQGITAEQVRRGMVFENHVGDRFIAGVPAQFRPSNEQPQAAPAPPPAAPKVSPTAARDAAVAKAVADVPKGCSAAGWRNVVHVLAADAYERLRTFDSWDVMQIGAAARPLCVAYERERRAGYGKEQAAKRAGADAATARLLAVYEAGR